MLPSVILGLLPDTVLPLVIVGAALGVVLRLIRFRTAFGIVGFILLMPLLSPIVEAALGSLPVWVSLLLLFFIVISIFRGLSTLVIGQRASDDLVGALAARVVFSVLFLPFRLFGWLIRAAFRI